ncbi:helix-turn-helix domain-containing protein [Desulfosporosinus sp. BICA1-9]|uniref:helix-turn-helix domain-containing protein n=1 Tax=Desulfosporosinus sp. BICA1-9 TaxID=1531958 RepID=UPI00054B8110|nr:helix-turn-helix domain-containing protein [Desulfosporosinus sp. BICA1-9]
MPHRARAVYMYLHDRADKEGKCYPAIGTIAKELKLSRSTVKRAIADLEKSGRLRKEQRWRENGGKSSNLYYVVQQDSS